MASYRTQADLLRGNFYVLESPSMEEAFFFIGPIVSKNEAKNQIFGSFSGYTKEERVFCGRPHLRLSREELLQILGEQDSFPKNHDLKLNDFKGYVQNFTNLQNIFEKTDLEKAVLYSTAHLEFTDFIELGEFKSILKKGLQNKTDGYLFAFYNLDNKSALLGCSPEYIYKKEGVSLKTTAVAGTKSLEDESSWSQKLLLEHKSVMDGISDSLEGKVEWSTPFDFKSASLKHLKAEGLISTSIPTDLLSDLLHPTPAVGTRPQKYFDQIKLGDLDRGFFGGYAEMINIESPFSIVTIRCMQWNSKGMQICIGGGVLPESKFDEEWAELKMKLESFKKLWGLQ